MERHFVIESAQRARPVTHGPVDGPNVMGMFRGAVSPDRYVRMAQWALWLNAAIVLTGASVRLTGSGLGCTDWPNCEEDQFVASLEYHALIEFGNRLFTGAVGFAVIIAVLGSLRRTPRRPALVWWSLGLVVGVLAQAILGAFVVVTHLAPQLTMAHFLLSMVLLWNATVLVEKAKVPDDEPPTPIPPAPMSDARRRIRLATRTVFVAGAGLLVTGTIVTGSGPHSGSEDALTAERLPFLVRDVTRIHAITAMVVLASVFVVIRRAQQAGEIEVREQGIQVASLLVLQGAIGYWQYFAGVPVLLVAIHIAVACVVWIQIVRLAWMAERVSVREPVLV
jgi:cytochrome c oxidase assembly protein subunit 15